jgi:ketosteroid isomerase-like protein
MHEIARKIQLALDTKDLSTFGELLDPDVHWGAPGARNPTCKNRDQVVHWYARAKNSGVEGRVVEVEVLGSRVVVGLAIRGSQAATGRGGNALRWQVYNVRDSRITDIVGFDDHKEAIAFASSPPPVDS